ncbi:MAG: EamA family transporter [Actinomycetota bacterium]
MAVILGLAAALTYGTADFFGGLATRKTRVFTVVLLMQVFGGLLLLALFPFFADVAPSADAIWWGALSGIAGGTGVTFFYQALAIGRMSIVAPITGVVAASVPVIFGLLAGERPSGLALGGVILSLLAVALVSRSSEDEAGETQDLLASGIVHALVAGLGFGGFFILLSEAGHDTGLWPLVGTRLSSTVLLAVALLVARGWEKPSAKTWPLIAGAGVCDVAANLFFLLAAREGLLSIVAVLTSMYPAATVLLARIVLGEKLGGTQLGGLATAALGVVAISVG